MDFGKLDVPLRSCGGGCGPLECDRVDPRFESPKDVTLGFILKNAEPFEYWSMSYIYFLISDKQVVYVGQTKSSVPARVACHAASGKVFDSVCSIPCPIDEMSEWEAYFILRFRPLFNSQLPKNNRFLTSTQVKSMFGVTSSVLKRLTRVYEIKPILWIEGTFFFFDDIANALRQDKLDNPRGFDVQGDRIAQNGGCYEYQ